MVTLIIPPGLLMRSRVRPDARVGRAKPREVVTPHRGGLAKVPEVTPLETATPHDFETEEKAANEDRLRARRMRRVLNRPGRTNWLNIKDRLWLANQSPRVVPPPLDREAAHDLANRLEAGIASGFPPLTLASSLRMRQIRQGLGRALLDAFEDYHRSHSNRFDRHSRY